MFDLTDTYLPLFEQNPMPMLIYDRETHAILRFNHTALTIYGYSQEEVTAMTVEDLHSNDERAMVGQSIRSNPGILRKVGIWKHRKKSGDFIDMEITTHDIDYHGRPARLALLVDVTARLRSEKEVERTRAMLETILSHISYGVLFVSYPQRTIEFANRTAEEMYGYQPGELVGQSTRLLFRSSEEFERFGDDYATQAATGQTRTFEREAQRKDGSSFPAEVALATIHDEEGQLTRVIGVVRDISAIKKNEEERRRLAHERDLLLERLQQVLTSMPVALIITDLELRITYWNPAAEQLFGYTAQEALGKFGYELIIPAEVHEFVSEAIRRILDEKATVVEVNANLTKDGRRILCRWHDTPLVDSSGEMIGFLAMVEDITEQQLAADRLEESEQRFRSLFEESPVALWLEDFSEVKQALQDLQGQGVSDLRVYFEQHPEKLSELVGLVRIIDVNPAAVSLQRAGDKQQLLDNLAEPLDEETTAFLTEVFIAFAGGNSPPDYEVPIKALDGGQLYVLLRSRVLSGHEDSLNRVLISMVDITQRKRVETALATQLKQMAAEAIEKQAVLDRLSQTEERMRSLAQQVVSAQEKERQVIARELHDEAGQNLTALKLALQMAADDLQLGSGEVPGQLGEAIHLTEVIMNQTRELARLLRPPRLGMISLEASLEGLCIDFGKRMRIPIHYQGCALPDLSEFMSLAIYRFVQEGLNNVAKHAHASQAWVSVTCDAETIEITIRDDGRGFDTGELQGKEGIGLRGMQERIALLNGRLDIQSRRQGGTRIAAAIPLEETE